MNKKIGIWGFGIVGKSVAIYFLKKNFNIEVIDQKMASEEDLEFLNKNNISFIIQTEQTLINFLEKNDFIIPSPGIDLRKYKKYKDKFLTELEIFYKNWKKPIIALTGTIGKTSIVHLLSQILPKINLKVSTGGNIGYPMLDLLKENSDYALLELSSFQLEDTNVFAPDIAIWTNLYPNHLDRHENIENYFEAKCKILSNQNSNQMAILPVELASKIKKKFPEKYFTFFSENLPNNSMELDKDILFYIESDYIVKIKDNVKTIIGKISDLPKISYKLNWLIISATCDALGYSVFSLNLKNLSLPEHRLEFVKSINEISFYNDSKSTIFESTLAAVNQLPKQPIHLLIGGIGKGVDRKPLISLLKNKVKSIYCFGKEAQDLLIGCKQANIEGYAFENLESAFEKAVKNAKPNEIILLSPAGASYDLFKNYQERGNRFKELVNLLS